MIFFSPLRSWPNSNNVNFLTAITCKKNTRILYFLSCQKYTERNMFSHSAMNFYTPFMDSKMKQFTPLFFFPLLCPLFWLGCFGNSPSTTTKSFFKHLKAGEINQAAALTVDGKVNTDIKGEDGEEAIRLLLTAMEYEIVTEQKNGNNATVTAKITNVPMLEVLASSAFEALGKGIGGFFDTSKEVNIKEELKKSVQTKLSDPKTKRGSMVRTA